MVKVVGKKMLLVWLVLLVTSCHSQEVSEDELLNISLLELVGIQHTSDLNFVIYDADGIEVAQNDDLYRPVLEAIQVTHSYTPDKTLEGSYGLMDIGNGVDAIKRLHLIDGTTISIGDTYYKITKGEALRSLVVTKGHQD